jgi:hypothetical protein
MKRLVLFLAVLLVVPFSLAAIPKDCYQNYTAIRCGEQIYFNSPDYCKNINLTIDDCYTKGDNFTVVFSGIEYFKVPDPVSRVTFSFYSRSWAWLGDEKNIPLPENATISALNDTAFVINAPLGGKGIESVQITVPFCYSQIDSDREKVYITTQAGKICRFVHEEALPEAVQENQTVAEKPAEASPSSNNWILLVLLVVVIVIGFATLRPRRKKK